MQNTLPILFYPSLMTVVEEIDDKKNDPCASFVKYDIVQGTSIVSSSSIG
jgi:hypothetical protein